VVRVSGVPYEVDLPPPKEITFDSWWYEMEGFGMRCERPQTHTEAAQMAWQYQQTRIDALQSELKQTRDQLEWLISIGK
jgi:hypothetical protein